MYSTPDNQTNPRPLPYSEDGEMGVLSSLLLAPRQVADICLLRLRPESFYNPAHQTIYSLVLEFLEKGKPVDFISLAEALKDQNRLESVGGKEFLSELYGFIPTASNAEYYVEIVREKYQRRLMILECRQVERECF